MLERIQKKYEFTNYQIKQLEYAFKVMASEISKMLIICLVMFRDWKLCLFVFFVMTMLRLCTGGIHCDTYIGCLFTSFIFVFLSINTAKIITPDKTLVTSTLVICAILSYILSPVISKFHQKLNREIVKRVRLQVFSTIMTYTLIFMTFKPNLYILTGCVVILFNTLQLIISKIITKGVPIYDEE